MKAWLTLDKVDVQISSEDGVANIIIITTDNVNWVKGWLKEYIEPTSKAVLVIKEK